jgi:hypothetical protein
MDICEVCGRHRNTPDGDGCYAAHCAVGLPDRATGDCYKLGYERQVAYSMTLESKLEKVLSVQGIIQNAQLYVANKVATDRINRLEAALQDVLAVAAWEKLVRVDGEVDESIQRVLDKARAALKEKP